MSNETTQLSWGQPATYKPTSRFSAVAQIFPTTNSTMHGRITFTQVYSEKQVMIEVDLSGAEPYSVHGLHLHTFGDTSDKLAMKKGGHFNPFNGTHGCPAVVAVEQDDQGRRVYNLPETNPFHVGDFGSLTFNDEGSARAVYISSQLSLWDSSAASFLMGHGFVVHALPDDCKTQPTGNSSVRLGQGVIAFRNRDAYIKPQLPASTNLGIAYFDGVNGVAGSIVAQGAGAFSFNLTGLPKGKITIMTTMSGDVNAIEPSAICSNETDFDLSKSASKITSLTTDDNGSIIQAVVVDAPHSSLSVVEMLGRGVLIVAGSCANVLAMAPMGIKFVDPPKSTTATSSATTTFSDQSSLTAFVSSEPTQASLPAASATSEYSLVQAPQYTASAKPLPAGPGSANLYASSAAGSFLAALVPLLCACVYLLV
ncbi:hypothetical protein HDU80_005542 [Chytriomyces hyalinus]|nr:hypothetical protein HDU80_005542 [Chytriomyces hyalinus]